MLNILDIVHGIVLTEKVQKIIKDKIREEQGGYRKERKCRKQRTGMLNSWIWIRYWRNWEAIWNMLKAYRAGVQLANVVKAFYGDGHLYVKVKGKHRSITLA